MRKAATMAIFFGLIALCIHTSFLRGRVLLVEERIEQRVQEELLLESRLRNVIAEIRRCTSVARLAARIRTGHGESEGDQLVRMGRVR